jgi:hypothetical protein
LPALVRLLVAVAVLVGPLQSGARYFYCEGLGLLASDPCARATGDGPRCPPQSLERLHDDCCQHITMPTVPDGARVDQPRVAPAGFVAVVAAADYVGTGVQTDPGRRFDERRVRRPPRPSEQRRAQLMVFLT